MMNLDKYLDAAQTHAVRMEDAKKEVSHLLPLTISKLENLTISELAYIELYTNRFAKLQDLFSTKIFPKLLELSGDATPVDSNIDRLNILERLDIINNTEQWMQLRNIRNQFLHEYPHLPQLVADNLNEAFKRGIILLECLQKVKKMAESIMKNNKN